MTVRQKYGNYIITKSILTPIPGHVGERIVYHGFGLAQGWLMILPPLANFVTHVQAKVWSFE